jgi:hypothetical protein
MDASMVGPGSVDPYKPFGSELKTKVNFGSKYEFKPDKNPGVGTYDPEPAMKIVKPRNYEAYFLSYKKPKPILNDGPAPGAYDSHLTPLGADIKQSMTLGGKYETKYNDNPPPGIYDIDRSKYLVGPMSRSTIIKQFVNPYRRPKENNPDPGQYDAHLTPFGVNAGNFTLGGPFKWKAD